MSDSENHVHPYVPEGNTSAVGIPIRHSRRGSLLDVGGVSSINNFASSVQRSVDYLSKSFDSKKGFLHEAGGDDESVCASEDLNTVLVDEEMGGLTQQQQHRHHPPHMPRHASTPGLAPLRENENTSYGTVEDTTTFLEDIRIIKSNETDIIRVISMKSTPMQTIFNSINVLIGLGILSIPMAFHLSGWILGVLCITLAAVATKQTAILLGRILKKHPHLKTYQDIGVFCFGERIGAAILVTFTVDLIGAGLSMILLFADSFYALSPEYFSKFTLKVGITGLLLFLNFLPLRLLSFLSLSGIICTTATCIIIFISGIIKIDSPGSLLHPMRTNMYPLSTLDFFFALGLYLAPWGGHATFPEIYNDQLYPQTYDRSMTYSFSFSYGVDLLTGILGFLMFGEIVEDEVTKNILTTKGYPTWVSTIIVMLMGILPISKLPLISRPLLTILDTKLGDSGVMKVVNRVLLSGLFLVCSTLLTDFGKVMSLLGSLVCFSVCVTLPALYYVAVFRRELVAREAVLWRCVAAMGVAGAVLGTVAVLLR